MDFGASKTSISIFVLLGFELDYHEWLQKHGEGIVPDASPYGYHYARDSDFSVEFSRKVAKYGKVMTFLQRTQRKILGFDFIHAWRNRFSIYAADVVWTHTEREYLAVSSLLRMKRVAKPRIVGQSVWLFDKWDSYGPIRKRLYRWSISRVDVLTFLSNENLKIAKQEFPAIPSEFIHFGISEEFFPVRPARMVNVFVSGIRVLAVGNDIHRDWDTLIKAVSGINDCQVKILTNHSLPTIPSNVAVERVAHTDLLLQYQWADIIVVPLKKNYHASGITALLEGIASGRPVICSDTGGLREYFTDNEVLFVTAGDYLELREAVIRLKENPGHAFSLVENSQKTMVRQAYTTRGYACRNKALTLKLLMAD